MVRNFWKNFLPNKFATQSTHAIRKSRYSHMATMYMYGLVVGLILYTWFFWSRKGWVECFSTSVRPKPQFHYSAETEYSAHSKYLILGYNLIFCRIPNILQNAEYSAKFAEYFSFTPTSNSTNIEILDKLKFFSFYTCLILGKFA